MTKIKIFGSENMDSLVELVNDFIKDKTVIDIQYQSFPVTKKFSASGAPINISIIDRAFIVYKEE